MGQAIAVGPDIPAALAAFARTGLYGRAPGPDGTQGGTGRRAGAPEGQAGDMARVRDWPRGIRRSR